MAEVLIRSSVEAAGALAADIIAAAVRTKANLVLGLATGSTPLTVYRALETRVREGLDLTQLQGFALDEYIGLPPGHREAYRTVLEREVANRLGMKHSAIATPDPNPGGLADASERYEQQLIDAGGVDVQILGIGTDGHIGFNEPGSSLGSLTRVKTLSAETRRDNARFFADPADVPVHCITQGIATILRARHLLLLAFGEHKAAALAAAVEGPITSALPASAIQLHPHVTVVVDDAAASRLVGAQYYRFAEAEKPHWQGY